MYSVPLEFIPKELPHYIRPKTNKRNTAVLTRHSIAERISAGYKFN